ncbi:uncharacterized protein EV420DRAFT_1747817 [Desarmillaria tabescens]|uniref:Heterokaryon incompatibility domain-containing protein n=1 Tax=Armillaria tabescens TaxID=1929756 RepID=A0AA39KCX9_ARMTA|nr:uncharacterized protein EV420DRAFT_1747817 [Desarmillaria tabescens]KAK0458864.1 hypothetical protein EV420DRAFT_1747817 [Desarmillaria tabescens]
MTPDLSPRSAHPEPPSDVGSQTSSMEEQPSGDASGDSDTFSEPDDDGPWHPPKNISLPEVNIYAFTETGQKESSIIVPLQRVYTGTKPAISSHLADTPCATLGVQGILNLLNATLATSYSLATPSLSSLLDECIENNWDFGTAYGRLRRIWYTRDWRTIQDTLRKWEEEDRKMRRKALVGNQIINPGLPPRRVWDLLSNRVVPWWSTGILIDDWKRRPQPISHAWMDEKDRVNVRTLINGYEWPVPIPKDTSLKLVRIETLNLGAEYVWLDVLCLRQVGGLREDMRTEEWKLDVPTIGAVYSNGAVPVIYLSGLGRPLTLKEGDLDSDRSWFRRAWTLQEVGDSVKRVFAGDMPDGPLHAKHKDRKYETPLLTRFHKQLASMEDVSDLLFEALEDMQKRVSVNPVDKVAGLAFVMRCKTIPAYYESQSLEDAWTAIVNLMAGVVRGQFFSVYPEPGNADRKWRPSWDQLMTKSLPASDVLDPDNDVNWDDVMDADWCVGPCIEKGSVRGLAVVEGGNRHGQLIVKGKDGMRHQFKITATHTYSIPADTYTLICVDELSLKFRLQNWVVGRRLPGERFEKVSVLQIPDKEEWRQLEDPHITEWCRNILV